MQFDLFAGASVGSEVEVSVLPHNTACISTLITALSAFRIDGPLSA